ncbi:MAG: DNA-3-methyladenine glycosylase I [Myxococcota bacterium]|jgi:DNA-3-methyladenine glycosylase I|nr:DNA-3-methyladenine glycosylase I [Myxococcota bacterium]
MTRCPWAQSPDDYHDYHDREWGVPVDDDRAIFEHLTLEAFQAGLSWITILRKREAFRRAFAGFDPLRVAAFDEADQERLMSDAGIVRNRQKIAAAIGNASAFLALQAEYGSAAQFFWGFVDGIVVHHQWQRQEDVPATTPLSERISKELKKRGFRFVGPTIVYAHLQATGIVNDHLLSCPRHAELAALSGPWPRRASSSSLAEPPNGAA